jgi:flagellar motor protein MotB
MRSKTDTLEPMAASKRRPAALKRRRQYDVHGTWKLVYADFVTVLMAFFIVAWILTFDKLSKIPQRDMSCITAMAADLKKQIEADVRLSRGKIPIEIELLHDGLRLTLLDNNQPMFQTGQAVLSAFAKEQFSKIAAAVNLCKANSLMIEGYTDATPYGGGVTGYGNWELSTERANAARRELLSKEVAPERISQVIGYGDSRPSLPDQPTSALNRRISITVLPTEGPPAGSTPSQETGKSGSS